MLVNDRETGRPKLLQPILIFLFLLLISLAFFHKSVFEGKVLLPLDTAFNTDVLWKDARPSDFAGAQNGLLTDVVTLFYPWKYVARQAILAGEMPLWDPYSFCGHPLLADYQSAVFYPINFLFYLLPLEQAFAATAVLRLLVAMTFTFLLGRELGLTRCGAVLAAVAFALSSPMVAWQNFPIGSAFIWLPAILWLSERALRLRQARYTVLTGLVLGIQFLAGHPETSAHMLLLWGLCLLWRGIPQARQNGWKSTTAHLLKFVALAMALGLALAAVEILPFLETLYHSVELIAKGSRSPSIQLWASGAWLLWTTLITLIFPDFYGNPVLGHNRFWFPLSNYNEMTIYFGLLPLFLALLGVAAWRSDWRSRLFTAAAILALGVALQFPVLVALDRLPPLNMVSNSRLRLVFVFACALLAGLGADRLRRDEVAQRVEKITWGLAIASLPLTLLAARMSVLLSEGDFPPPDLGQVFLQAVKDIDLEFIRELLRTPDWTILLPFPLLLIFAVALSLRNRAGFGNQALMPVLIGLVVADLFLIGADYNPALDPPGEEMLNPKAVALIKERITGVERVTGIGYAMFPNSSTIFQLPDVRGYDPTVSNRYYRLSLLFPGRDEFGRGGFVIMPSADPNLPRLLNLLGVKYLISSHPLQGEGLELIYDESAKIYENQRAFPRAFLVFRQEVLPPEQILARLSDPSFDLASVVLLEEAPPADWAQADSPGNGRAQIQEYRFNHVVVEAESTAPAFLVLSDSYAPGWSVSVDGAEAPLYLADYSLRAVPLSPGKHVVRFTYSPLSFKIGAGLSLAVLLATLALALLSARRGGKSTDSARLPKS